MHNIFILLLMIFLHIIDDFKLQGILASMKQKSWWINQDEYKDYYKYDYIVALIVHSFSWIFMVMLPVFVVNRFDITNNMIVAFICNMCTHAIVDHMKANMKIINLVIDQTIHMIQILLIYAAFIL